MDLSSAPNRPRRLVFAFSALSLLLVPLVASLVTDEVAWSLADYAVMGALLTATALGAEWLTRRVAERAARLLGLAGLAVAFLLAWAELAVGIFGSPLAGS